MTEKELPESTENIIKLGLSLAERDMAFSLGARVFSIRGRDIPAVNSPEFQEMMQVGYKLMEDSKPD